MGVALNSASTLIEEWPTGSDIMNWWLRPITLSRLPDGESGKRGRHAASIIVRVSSRAATACSRVTEGKLSIAFGPSLIGTVGLVRRIQNFKCAQPRRSLTKPSGRPGVTGRIGSTMNVWAPGTRLGRGRMAAWRSARAARLLAPSPTCRLIKAQGLPVDARSDVFSFGLLLYELLTGRRAFVGDTSVATLAAVVNAAPPRLEAPRILEQIVSRCLAKQPRDRFQSMADVAAALEQTAVKPDRQRPSVAVLPFANMSRDPPILHIQQNCGPAPIGPGWRA